MKVLIAYASAHGSTAEVAQFIGQVLEERQFEATVASVETIQTVEGYDACIVGSAIHAGMWLTPMSRFLDRFERELAARPLYMFITCIRVLEPDGREHALQHYIHQETLQQLGVREVGVFAGKLRLDAIDMRERWTLSLRYDGSVIPGEFNDDFRDWEAIRAWAVSVGERLATA